MNTGSSRSGGTAISIRAGRDVREEVVTPSFTPASLFVVLVLPMLPAHHTVSRPHSRVAHPFREPLRFTVTTVTVVTLPISMGFRRDAPLLGSPCTVTPIVAEEGPSLCWSLSGVTIVTLVTVDGRLILDRGERLYFVGSLTPST